MFANPANFEDVAKYFKGCYIEVNKDIFLVNKVTSQAIFCSNDEKDDFAIEIDGKETKTVGYDLNFPLPTKTWFQKDKSAVFLYRIPARMWKKGISKENTAMTCLQDSGRFRSESLTFPLLKLYLEEKNYLSYKEITKYDSIALNPRFALSYSGNVFLDSSCVAKYDRKDKTVVTPSIYLPEITQLFEGCKILCL